METCFALSAHCVFSRQLLHVEYETTPPAFTGMAEGHADMAMYLTVIPTP